MGCEVTLAEASRMIHGEQQERRRKHFGKGNGMNKGTELGVYWHDWK